MKKIFLFSLLFLALQVQAQKFTIDLDSVSENKVFIKDYKWKGSKDTVLVLTVKVNGQFYTNADSSEFNFNVTFKGKLDSAKGVKIREKQLQKDAEELIRKEEARLLRMYEKNRDVDPKLRERANAPRQGVIRDVPKSYGNTSLANPNPKQILVIDDKPDYPPQKKK